MHQQVGHLTDLVLIVPGRIGLESVANEEVAQVDAVDGARQAVDIDVCTPLALALHGAQAVAHRTPDALAPDRLDAIAELDVVRELEQERRAELRIARR